MNFTVAFSVVFTLFFAYVLYEGFMSYRGNQGEADYLVAGRSMGPWIGGASIAATQMSAGTFVGTVGVHYLTGSSFMAAFIGIWVAFILSGFVLAPRLRRYVDKRGALTFPDFIADRFGPKIPRVVIVILLIGAYTVFLSAQYQAGGIVLGQVFDISYFWASTGLMIFVVLYTVVGGMTAVMRTDFIQQIVMAGAVLIGVPFAIRSAGGLGGLGASLADAAPKFTGWSYGWVDLLGFSMGFGFAALTAPVLLMRYYAMRDERACAQASVVAVLFTMLTFGGIAIIGMSMRVIRPGLSNPDTASTIFATDVLPPIVGALMLTAIIAAVLSTVDSVLLVIGPAVSHDIYAKMIRPQADEKERMRVNRIATVVLGVVPILLTLAELSIVQFVVLAYASLIGATVSAPLIFGLFWKRANKSGAVVSMLGGFGICTLWYVIDQPFVAPIFPGIIVNVVLMVLVSFLTASPDRKVLAYFFDTAPDVPDPSIPGTR